MLNFASETLNVHTLTYALNTGISNKEREIQDLGDKDMYMYNVQPIIIDNIDVETLIDKGDFEIYMC